MLATRYEHAMRYCVETPSMPIEQPPDAGRVMTCGRFNMLLLRSEPWLEDTAE